MSRDFVSSPRGELVIRGYRAGRLVLEDVDRNLIVNSARSSLALLLGGDAAAQAVSHVAFGTNNAAADPADSAITEAHLVAVGEPEYPEPGVVRFPWQMSEAEADGMTIWEAGLLTADGALFARRVRSKAIEKDGLELAGEWTIYF